MKFITINGLIETNIPTGLKFQLQLIQEKLLKVVLHLLTLLLLNRKHSKQSKLLILLQDMPNKPQILSIRIRLVDKLELNKLEEEPKTQEIQRDGDSSGQLVH